MLTPATLASFNRAYPKESILDKFFRELSPTHSSPNELISSDSHSNSTVKSVYFESAGSQKPINVEEHETEMQVILQARRAKLARTVATNQIQFNLLVVGDTGSGKTTFVHSVLAAKFGISHSELNRVEETSRLEFTHYRASRRDDNLLLTIDFVDTPGYGHFSKQEIWLKRLRHYIASQARSVREQKQCGLKQIEDSRVHLCLYFISGPLIETSDISAMKALEKWVSVLPVIAKADLYTTFELAMLKRQLTQRAQASGVTWFDCRSYAGELIGEASVPFAVSSFLRVQQNELLFNRRFPWGLEDCQEGVEFDLLARLILSCFVVPAVNLGKAKARQWNTKTRKRPSQPYKRLNVIVAVTLRLSQFLFS